MTKLTTRDDLSATRVGRGCARLRCSSSRASPREQRARRRARLRHRAAGAGEPDRRADADAKSAGCLTCHTQTDRAHDARESGGQARLHRLSRRRRIGAPAPAARSAAATGVRRRDRARARAAALSRVVALPVERESGAHVHAAEPREPASSSASSIRPTIASRAKSCGACHLEIIEASVRSLHSTGAMLWGGAAYNNGILPTSSSTSSARPTTATATAIDAEGPEDPGCTLVDAAAIAGILPQLYPLPAWETIKPGDIFRVFERGGRNIAQPVPGDRPAERARPAAADRRAGPAGLPPVESRPGHRRAHRGAGHQHHQDAPQRSVHVVHRHERSAGRLPSARAARRATSSTRTIAIRGTRACTRSSATTARRRPSTRRSARPSRAIR